MFPVGSGKIPEIFSSNQLCPSNEKISDVGLQM